MGEWACEQSVVTKARRMEAWAYWSDLSNHAEEPGVEKIELDGPFATGTTGRTIGTGFQQERELTDVVEGRRFGITGFTPDGDGALSFAWHFEDEGDGTRMTYRIRAYGPEVEGDIEVFRQMELNAPKALAALALTLDRLALEDRSDEDLQRLLDEGRG